MKCNNRICIFENENECVCPDEIEIDWRGLCKNMVPIRITQRDLETHKLYTKTIYENEKEYDFDREIGEVTLKEEFRRKYE